MQDKTRAHLVPQRVAVAAALLCALVGATTGGAVAVVAGMPSAQAALTAARKTPAPALFCYDIVGIAARGPGRWPTGKGAYLGRLLRHDLRRRRVRPKGRPVAG